jgi:hypothetical protein
VCQCSQQFVASCTVLGLLYRCSRLAIQCICTAVCAHSKLCGVWLSAEPGQVMSPGGALLRMMCVSAASSDTCVQQAALCGVARGSIVMQQTCHTLYNSCLHM